MTDTDAKQLPEVQLAHESVLFVAPHPDDETLAAGGFLQQLLRSGSRVRVIFLTDGERNPLAHSAMERRFCLGSAARERFRTYRRDEALRAMAHIGIAAENCTFLSLPDSFVSRAMANGHAGMVIANVRSIVRSVNPTLILIPCRSDLHPDHRAAARLLETAMAGGIRPATTLRYAIHRPPGLNGRELVVIPLSSRELERKRAAIGEYRSQLILSRRRFLSFAQQSEEFHESCSTEPSISEWARRLMRLWTIVRGSFRRRKGRRTASAVLTLDEGGLWIRGEE
ncbi:MAG TPA: PIG-L family deacetylase [Thermoanaerobaculia bacterium]|nr:PIG-L family deacetylase [Thermoanaerobaculia bacterium]